MRTPGVAQVFIFLTHKFKAELRMKLENTTSFACLNLLLFIRNNNTFIKYYSSVELKITWEISVLLCKTLY